MDTIRCTFVRLSDGLQLSTWARHGKLGNAWIRASQKAGQALDCLVPGVQLECIAVQDNDEPWVYLPIGWSEPSRRVLANDIRRSA